VGFMSNVANLIGRGCCSSRKAISSKARNRDKAERFFQGRKKRMQEGAAEGVPQEGTAGEYRRRAPH